MTAAAQPDERQARARAVADEWSPRLRRYAASVVRDEHLARDAVQDVLLRLCDADRPPLKGLDEEPRLRAWLFKAVRHRCIDYLRREGRMTLLDEHPPAETQPRLAAADPAEQAAANDDTAAALAALDRLPPLQREALRLKFAGELSYAQIADAMDKTVGHVGVLIHEGLKTLRKQLAH